MPVRACLTSDFVAARKHERVEADPEGPRVYFGRGLEALGRQVRRAGRPSSTALFVGVSTVPSIVMVFEFVRMRMTYSRRRRLSAGAQASA